MELSHDIRKVNHTAGSDVLKIKMTPAGIGLHEVKFVRTSTNSRDPKEFKFYLEAGDMFEFEAALKVYNKGLVDRLR